MCRSRKSRSSRRKPRSSRLNSVVTGFSGGGDALNGSRQVHGVHRQGALQGQRLDCSIVVVLRRFKWMLGCVLLVLCLLVMPGNDSVTLGQKNIEDWMRGGKVSWAQV